ncbi:MAG TPA: RHS repeat-associated core domain-containing protein [Verrucomicrobiae bacterium]|nr:RHS repeat-associated core domain-containing protein [Verrucomicrobiae bacterium]
MRRRYLWMFLLAVVGASTPANINGTTVERPGLTLPANPSADDISRARVFDETLVPIGVPDAAENAALARALVDYSKRRTVDDFSSLTEFLKRHPDSAWKAALLTCLGLEYYNTAHYSVALEAWREAWELGQKATDLTGKLLADRVVCELAGLYSRLGRMDDLAALLKSLEQRVFIGGATERISLAREALWMMQNKPGVSFRCGPLALQSIKRFVNPAGPADLAIFNSTSTQQGFSLRQVAELSKHVGLNYQMARRDKTGEFVIPSVVHWKVGHFAAIVRKVGDLYLLEDPTFMNTAWATRQALETETSGYFLIPGGDLPPGWHRVDVAEAGTVWGKGVTSGIDPDNYTPEDLQAGTCEVESSGPTGMAISRVHLGLANLQIRDTPVGYTPPVGPAVRFTVRYNHRDYIQKPSTVSRIFGPKWTHDWNGAITDNPLNPLADVKYIVGGGGARTFTGFDTNTQTYAPQQFEQTRLLRAGVNRYEMTYPNGSKRIFGRRVGTSGVVLLTEVMDPAGNAVTLSYDGSERLTSLTDAIGQVTTIAYEHPSAPDVITKVTDPFGRFATFDYRMVTFFITNCCPTNIFTTNIAMLAKITDVLGLESRFDIQDISGFITGLTTPYGATTFSAGQGGGPNDTTRFVETLYPDGSRDRVEFNQNTNGIAFSDPPARVPQGMSVFNQYLHGRNTFYWSRSACATAYGDYSKAKIYHWLHTPNLALTAGILESTKEPLEGRVWYDYAGQPSAFQVGSTDRPSHVGRVLDDGTTQLYTYGYNRFGHVTNILDPLGRRLAFTYHTNEIDLLEVRQTRGTNNESLFKATYNTQHRPLMSVDAAGQTNTFTYNARGQVLTKTNPKGETTRYTYNLDSYLISVDGPLPGTNDTIAATYDAFGRTRTVTALGDHALTLNYDDLDRPTRVTYADSTFTEYAYNRLDLSGVRERDGRQTLLEYDALGQVRKKTDPLGRVTLFSWCRCGSLRSLIDPMGRATEWHTDIQGRLISKQYSDGSKILYEYDDTTSRLRQVIDEKEQITHYLYNRDDTLKSVAYLNTMIPMPIITFAYDPNYERPVSMVDGTGTTLYSYHPITPVPTLGAGQLASVDGPLPDDTITYGYDELGRRVSTSINGVASTMTYDAAGRVATKANALGAFTYSYDGSSGRVASQSFPNGQIMELVYGNNSQDRTLQRMTHHIGATPISEFIYGHDVASHRITSWSQQAGAQSPLLHTFGYDAASQLISANITNAGVRVKTLAYSYDLARNRLTEQIEATNHTATYNGLNQLSTSTAPGVARTNEWDAENRLIAVSSGDRRTEFTYDGLGRTVGIRQSVNGSEVSNRHFLWYGAMIGEERDATGVVTKRFFPEGMQIEIGPTVGTYYYTRDHLGSIREITDSGGYVRARYDYDPYGRRIKLQGDIDADFGFAGMFWAPEVNLSLTLFRAYDAEQGRWLSRDPLKNAELIEGPNLYAYVANNPVNAIDPLGLCGGTMCMCGKTPGLCATLLGTVGATVEFVRRTAPAAIAVGQRIAACGQAVWGRAMALYERVPEARGWAQQYLADLTAEVPSGQRMLEYARGGLRLPEFYAGLPNFVV